MTTESTTAGVHVTSDVPIPFPLRLPSLPRSFKRRRAAQTAAAAARHFAPVAMRRLRASGRDAPLPFARPLRLTFEDLGATYLKFGQVLGSAPGVFGDEVAAEFRTCLDTGPTVDGADVRAIVENELGHPIDRAFSEFSPQPIAAASIAVVHRGRLHDGRDVAVKVLRPGIEQTVTADIDLMVPLLETLTYRVGLEMTSNILDALGGFREQIAEELDLRNEARTMAHFLDMLDEVHLPQIAIPEPYPEFSGRRVLTMEFLEGNPIDDLAAAADFGIDPAPLVQDVVRAWFMTAIRNGTFHGDIHAGNLLLLNDGRLGVLDWGIVGRLDEPTHQFFRRIVEAALGDETAWDAAADHIVSLAGADALSAMGVSESDVRLLVRLQLEPLLVKPFGEVSLASLLMSPQEMIDSHHESESDADGAADGSVISAAVARLRKWRRKRRVHAQMSENEFIGSSFDRGTFLLGKQLMYFERYGKMFLKDVPLLSDREFFEQVLSEDALRVRKREWAYA